MKKLQEQPAQTENNIRRDRIAAVARNIINTPSINIARKPKCLSRREAFYKRLSGNTK